jgi:hypothetical protein
MCQAGRGLRGYETAQQGITRVGDRSEDVLQGEQAVLRQAITEGSQKAGKAR